MTYENITLTDLFKDCLRSSSYVDVGGQWESALAWAEAVNIRDVWLLVKQWFDAMQSGEAINRLPDPFWGDAAHPGRKPLTQDVADQIVREMDEDFHIESSRFPKETGLGPEFSRLAPLQRMAFAQQLYGVMKTRDEIKQEAKGLMDLGPPYPWP